MNDEKHVYGLITNYEGNTCQIYYKDKCCLYNKFDIRITFVKILFTSFLDIIFSSYHH